jgi:hypothetical protein
MLGIVVLMLNTLQQNQPRISAVALSSAGEVIKLFAVTVPQTYCMKEEWKSRLKRDMIETTVKEEMVWLCLAEVLVEMGRRSPFTSGRSAAKAGPKNLGILVTGLAIDSSCGPRACAAGSKIASTAMHRRSSRVIDGPEQGTGQGTSACGWRDDDKKRFCTP